jgi:hypothetical protein
VHAIRCTELLEADDVEVQARPEAGNLCARLKIWAAGVGVFSQGDKSVEHCLQGNNKVFDLLIVILGHCSRSFKRLSRYQTGRTMPKCTMTQEENMTLTPQAHLVQRALRLMAHQTVQGPLLAEPMRSSITSIDCTA